MSDPVAETPAVAEAPKSSFPSGFGQAKAPVEEAVPGGSPTPAAPIFGFGTGSTSGFGGFGGATFDPSMFAVPRTAAAATEDDGDDDAAATADVEAECKAEFVPLVKLEHVEVASGEENEDILFEAKSKSYRFIEGEWKERGVGPLKLLQHKENKKIRFLMRRDKTLKVCGNFFVVPGTKIEEHAGSDKARVFTTMDCSDGDVRPTMWNMCCKFGSVEKAELFQAEFEKAMVVMKGIEATEGDGEKAEAKEEGDAAADALAEGMAKAAVAEEKVEEKAEEVAA
eukprot:CAMPEP_0197597166 /NCGR_PEP_ID=MMETSP1326-20131121/26747_1 /TAXON_ID=1155430 /ORGANISM="Genus nov. species nov., Strain RCC2288" /LENGTH=282 /DNA_ID=CAMNT_0043163799 /DNA_START=65 /DNA_END=913 /DNA_ORIENTATION=+